MSQLPDRVPPGGPQVPARLTSEEFERVIRRAAELQARGLEGETPEGVEEAEAVRIGKELGLSTLHLNQALAEVRGGRAEPHGLLDRWLGPADVQASRTIAADADDVRTRLEQYLVGREYMSVQRRFPDRTVFVRGTGVAATVGRATSQIFSRTQPLRVSNLTVAVQPLEEGFCHVALATRLSSQRAGYVAGAVGAGGGGGAAVAAVLAVAIAPPAALLGLPILAGAAAGARFLYAHQAEREHLELESLLDRLEHGELPRPAPRRPPPF